MKKKLALIFSLMFLITFLIFPSITHTERTEDCSDDPYANCSPGHTSHFGQFLGGIKYVKASFNNGSFSLDEELVQNAPINNGGYFEGENQYFKPLLAIAGAGLVSVVVTAILYFRNTKQKI